MGVRKGREGKVGEWREGEGREERRTLRLKVWLRLCPSVTWRRGWSGSVVDKDIRQTY